jgi:competence protein ComEC
VFACVGSPAAAVLPRIRRAALAAVETHVPEGQRGLAAALLLGSRECLARNELDGFLVTGTVHLLAISGLHVGLIAYGLHRLLRLVLLPRRRAAVVVAIAVGFYMLLVRSETPVVRATLVVWLAALAVVIDRRSSALNALAVAAIVLLAWRPADVTSAGAQLSFLSTAVLVGMAGLVPPPRSQTDPIERLIERSRPRAVRWLANVGRQTLVLLVAGVAVWAATAPLVAARFQMVSPLGIVLNVVLSPLVAAAMACGFVCLLVAPWAPALAAASGLACGGTLGVIQRLVALAAAVPGGHMFVPPPPGWWVAGWYAGLVVACCRLSPPRLRRATTWLALAGGWCVVGILGHHAARLVAGPPPGLRIVVAAVGHGCGIVVRTPEGRTLVYDAGRLGAPAAARRAVAGVLWNHGLRRIDTLVVSHADADHFNAVPGLLERFTIGEIVVSPAFGRRDGSPTAAGYVLELARSRGVPVRVVQAGDRFALDRSCLVRVLHPAGDDDAPGKSPGAASDAGRRTTDNETSLVLAIDAAGRRLLLTGDLEGPALAAFAAGGPGTCDVLVAPHHGSRTSLPPDIAVATRPEWVLVSGRDGPHWPGVREAYRTATGHPHAVVAHTGAAGAIAIDLAATGFTASRFTGGRWRPVPDLPAAASAAAPRR